MSRKRKAYSSSASPAQRLRRNATGNENSTPTALLVSSRVHTLLAPKDELAKSRSSHALLNRLRSGKVTEIETACMILATWFQQDPASNEPLHSLIEELINDHGLLAALLEPWNADSMRKTSDGEFSKKSSCLTVIHLCLIFMEKHHQPFSQYISSKEVLFCLMASLDEVLIKIRSESLSKTHSIWFQQYAVDFFHLLILLSKQLPREITNAFLYSPIIPSGQFSPLFDSLSLIDYVGERIFPPCLQASTLIPYGGPLLIASVEFLAETAPENLKRLAGQSFSSIRDLFLVSSHPHLAMLTLRLAGCLDGFNQCQIAQDALLTLFARGGEPLLDSLVISPYRKVQVEESEATVSDGDEPPHPQTVEVCEVIETICEEAVETLRNAQPPINVFAAALSTLNRFYWKGASLFPNIGDNHCLWTTLLAVTAILAEAASERVPENELAPCDDFSSLEKAAAWFGLITAVDGASAVNIALDDEKRSDLSICIESALGALNNGVTGRSHEIKDQNVFQVYEESLSLLTSNLRSHGIQPNWRKLFIRLCPILEIIGNTPVMVSGADPYSLKKTVTRLLFQFLPPKDGDVTFSNPSLMVYAAQCLIDIYQGNSNMISSIIDWSFFLF